MPFQQPSVSVGQSLVVGPYWIELEGVMTEGRGSATVRISGK